MQNPSMSDNGKYDHMLLRRDPTDSRDAHRYLGVFDTC